ncbi:type I restriction modification system, N-6 DNA Methylase [Nostoc sp. NIES-4103]|nr:type I restriction modification system, N-6 DNA Methylase [Nostoc sp. NIES-4103]
MNLAAILKDSNYKLSQFTSQEIDNLEKSIVIKQTKSGDVPYIQCLVRSKEIKLTPEEAVRQLYLQVLTQRYHYPVSRITVEYIVTFGREKKKADIAISDKDRPNVPYIIVELKKPKLKDGKEQLRSYCNATGAPIGIWTNGDQISYYQRKNPNYFEDITDIPNANQTLADILNVRFTLDDLIKKDKLVNEKKSLKALIEEMEDEVLANAGVDVFEEVFKLIFTKLYDEWLSGRGNNRHTRLLEFRNTGQTDTALKNKIQDLFDRAKKHWEGVFSEDSKIALTVSHLSICVSSLENVKLFNSNLDIVDEAFEYLINQSSKGEKGQYFTPRYVIDMCVKMLNPQEDEYMIDTAAGSSGFPVHTIFHVWKQILDDEEIKVSNLFSLEDKPYRCEKYVQEKVFAIDFDEKAVRVARTLNLIAGDGQTNVLHLNTLDFASWDEVTRDEDWQNIYFEGFKRLKKLRRNKDSYKEFQFDILMANPPFAGDIKEPQIIHRYDLAKKPNGGWQSKVGRDILFIERNLDFLKPGGRMAIVLPQGRFNNSSDKDIRDFIAERCRILAVVGLHGNTFKPHTGTKTSVLLVQKWNDDPKAGALCPRVDDYNIFFATMRKSGKDNSGEKIWRRVLSSSEERLSEQEKEKIFLQDIHGHLVVDHDLFNHDGLGEDGIAEAFIEFAKKENLSFFKPSPSVTPFDEAKYQQLMDGLEAAEVSFSQVKMNNEAFRYDSEFFKKSYLLNDSVIKQKKYLFLKQKIKDLKSFGAYSLCNEIEYLEEGIPFLRCVNIKQFQVNFADVLYISEKSHALLWKSEVKPEMVLLTMSGSAGNVAIAYETWKYPINSNQDIAKIKFVEGTNPYFVYIFFTTKYGYNQIQRQLVGSVQQHIFLWQIEKLVIPEINIRFKSCIEYLSKISNKQAEESLSIYNQAEELLLKELKLKDWQPPEENIAEKSFSSSFLASGRLDAEYYQPKQQKIMDVMGSSGLQIKDVANLAKRKFQPSPQGTFNYIEIGNLSGDGFANSDIIDMSEAPSRAQWIVKTNDIITSTVRPIRRLSALIEKEQNNYVCSSGFAVLKPMKVEPEVLLVYLRLPVVCEILDLHTTASMYPAISTEDLLNIPITLPNERIRQEIVEKVKACRKASEQSKKLLEIAKTGVEKAIETDEATATAWMNQQLAALGINSLDD